MQMYILYTIIPQKFINASNMYKKIEEAVKPLLLLDLYICIQTASF